MSAATRTPARPDVLAYPSPTSARFLTLVFATLATGFFVGTWVHSFVLGEAWRHRVLTCMSDLPPMTGPAQIDARTTGFETCLAPIDRPRALFSIAALVYGIIAGAVVLYLAPILVGRRRRLRPAGPRLAAAVERFEQMSRAAGLTRVPALMVGSAAQLDAFSYGVPGRYRVVLPLGVVIRPGGPAFEALVAHELAHVARRDVTVAWLARSVGYAVVPMLLLPVALAVAAGDTAGVPGYAWRALLLGAVIAVARAAILRSREHDADLQAARRGSSVVALSSLLSSIAPAGRRGLRRLLANHPGPRSRIETLHRPAALARVGFADSLTVAFLVAVITPSLSIAILPLLTDAGLSGLADVVAAAVTGVLAGGTIGLGLWRAALVRRVAGLRVRLAAVVAGMFAGTVLGGLVSPGGDAVLSWFALLTAALYMAAGTVTVAGLGELWADAAGRLRTARASWIAAVVLSSILFGTVWWMTAAMRPVFDGYGWTTVLGMLPVSFSGPPILVATLVLAAAAAWALWAARSVTLTPAWLLESGPRHPWPVVAAPSLWSTAAAGAAAGVAGTAVMIGFRAVAGAAASDVQAVQRYYAYVFVAAATAAAVTLVLAALSPGRGAGAALLAAPIAATVTMAGFLALNTALGGDLRASFVTEVLHQPIGLALLAETLAAGVVLLPPADRRRPAPLLIAAATAAALLAAITAVAARDWLTPL